MVAPRNIKWKVLLEKDIAEESVFDHLTFNLVVCSSGKRSFNL